MSKVMIVDDEMELRDMLDIVLTRSGFETSQASDGEEFLGSVDEIRPDLVTLDVKMPGLNTIEILQALGERDSGPKIVILSVTRFSDEEWMELSRAGNVVDYMVKPFDIHDFVEMIRMHLS
jgi:DNA-binding response OmpR family regulator